ncbi:hypothetical protein OFN63_33205, partial [Escherichia coli]|nr:hypothetical protein [Escherichia coli]
MPHGHAAYLKVAPADVSDDGGERSVARRMCDSTACTVCGRRATSGAAAASTPASGRALVLNT